MTAALEGSMRIDPIPAPENPGVNNMTLICVGATPQKGKKT